MIWRVAARLGYSLLMLLAVSALWFGLLAAARGEYFDEAKLNPRVSPETLEKLRSAYGLSQPLPVRYVKWLSAIVRGDLGVSIAYNQPVGELLRPRLVNTVLLTSLSLIAAWGLAIPLGIWAGARRATWQAGFLALAAGFLMAVPEVVSGTLLVYWAARSGILPTGGMRSGYGSGSLDVLRHVALPAVVLAAAAFPVLFSHVRRATEEACHAPFLSAVRALGISPFRLWCFYVLPVAANPLISLLGLSIAGLLSSSLVVETIFGWPGLGPIFLEAILARDTYLILGPVLCSVVLLIAANLLVDLLLLWIDPRIRTEKA
jgi:peptide/nickel transport system permease protein